MQLSIQPIHRNFALQMCHWRYEPPYDIYNLAEPPGEETLQYLLDPTVAFHAIVDEAGQLVGFCSFGEDGQVPGGDYSTDALDIGMGVHPNYTGQGLGATFAAVVVEFARRTYAPQKVRVTIAHFNERAQRVWQKLGFERVAQFESLNNGAPFVIFERVL